VGPSLPDAPRADRMHLLLREKLGPSVLQFPWFNKHEIQLEEFLRRLPLFLQRVKNLPSVRFVIEIRNKNDLINA